MAFTLSIPSLESLLVLEGGFVRPKRWGVLTPKELELAVTRETMVQCCDDDRDGEPDFKVVAQIIENAEAEASSYLIGYYDQSTKKATDRLLKLALIDLAQSFMFKRHPEYVKTFGKDGRTDTLFKSGITRLEKVQQATQKLPDVEPDKGPKNSGIFLESSGPRTIVDGTDGSNNNPMF